MIDALGMWLKQIVVIVLLATFIDLLLPNRSMQRYVKLVVSLFILMTILSPVMRLLGSNPNVRMLAASVNGWSVGGTLPPGVSSAGRPQDGSSAASIPTLAEVLAQGETMERQRNEQSLELLAARLESMIVDHVKTHHHVESAAAEAELGLDRDGLPVIRAIRIRLGPGADRPAAADPVGAGGVVSVEPVVIEPVRVGKIDVGGRGEDQGQGGDSGESEDRGQSGDNAAAGAGGYDRKAIAASVAAAWGISPALVSVEAEAAT